MKMLRESPAPIRFQYGTHRGAPALAVPVDTPVGRTGTSFLATLRDLALIALAWAIFAGIMIYPAAQLVGIAACAVALLAGVGRRSRKATARG